MFGGRAGLLQSFLRCVNPVPFRVGQKSKTSGEQKVAPFQRHFAKPCRMPTVVHPQRLARPAPTTKDVRRDDKREPLLGSQSLGNH